ncbi:MAG TPA: glycosyltransferase family 87 protein [Acidobacteriaceae bacterium]|jgi:hypothetical protein
MIETLRPWREGKPWLTNAVLFLLGCGLLLLTRQLLAEHVRFAIGFSGVSGWSAIVFLAAVVVVLTQLVNRWTLWLIVAFAVAMQGMVLFSAPFTSSDMYRYVWDGIVQHAHVNPYRYVPGDPALAYLREPHRDVFDHINRRDYARTIYPPVAQMIYWAITLLSPTVVMMKLALVAFAGIAGVVVTRLLVLMGRRREEILLYAWCPLLVWEIGLAGHVDAVVLMFIALALLFRFQGKPVLVGLFLGLAVLTKFYPLVLFPALWMRRDWKMPAVMVALAAVTYSVYLSAGKLVLGFLSGYKEEEGLNSGTRFFLLQLAQKWKPLENLPVVAYEIFCVAVFAGLMVWAWRRATPEVAVRGRRPEFVVTAMAFAFAMMLLFSPHYPWYVLWLIPFLALVPNLPVAAYLMGMFYLLTTALADGNDDNTFILNSRLYVVVAVAMVVQWMWSRWGDKAGIRE